MILRRSTTRRVPSGASRTRSSSQPPCSARSTSSRVTDAAGELPRDRAACSNSYSTPGSAHALRRRGSAARTCHGARTRRPADPPIAGRLPETSSRACHDLGGQLAAPRRSSEPAQLGGGARADDRGGDARAGRGPRPAPPRAATSPGRRRPGRPPRRPAASARRGSAPTKLAKCGDAARESAGVPLRYLPVSTPRPSGDQGRMPRPSAAAAGTTSGSMPRLSREYSTWVEASGARPGHRPLPGGGLGGLPAGVVARRRRTTPGRSRPRGRARVRVSSSGVVVDPDVHLPQVDVVDAEPPQRGVEAC